MLRQNKLTCNCIIGVIMNSIQESHDEIQEVLMKKELKNSSTESLIRDLERKIDGLKSDIKRLNDNLRIK